MAEICCGAVRNSRASTPCEGSSRAVRRRRMEIRRFKIASPAAAASSEVKNEPKRQKLEAVYTVPETISPQCDNGLENCDVEERKKQKLVAKVENGKSENKEIIIASQSLKISLSPSILAPLVDRQVYPKFGVASVCGRRRVMEDAVAVYPYFCHQELDGATQLHFFGVYDGHGCSHVAMRCRERLHELVKEEIGNKEASALSPMEWKRTMEGSFRRMDEEVVGWNNDVVGANCRCEMQTPDCDAVGSTAVVAIVTPDKIIVANCGDSRAVLCRDGKSIPLSSDHKPDRPDELNRIQAAGGLVIFWDGPRVLGVLAMSRAIGDDYLKPYVICLPEVTITERTAEDDCLILASDGLWDVVSNDTACGVARMCLRGKREAASCSPLENEVVETRGSGCGGGGSGGGGASMSDKACSDASMLLTKLALARHSTDNVSVVVVDIRRDT